MNREVGLGYHSLIPPPHPTPLYLISHMVSVDAKHHERRKHVFIYIYINTDLIIKLGRLDCKKKRNNDPDCEQFVHKN